MNRNPFSDSQRVDYLHSAQAGYQPEYTTSAPPRYQPSASPSIRSGHSRIHSTGPSEVDGSYPSSHSDDGKRQPLATPDMYSQHGTWQPRQIPDNATPSAFSPYAPSPPVQNANPWDSSSPEASSAGGSKSGGMSAFVKKIAPGESIEALLSPPPPSFLRPPPQWVRGAPPFAPLVLVGLSKALGSGFPLLAKNARWTVLLQRFHRDRCGQTALHAFGRS